MAVTLLLATMGSCDSDPVVEPEPSLEIVPDSITLTHIGHQFTFSVRGGGAVQWNSRDLAVFTVNAKGTVTARGNGEARVQAWTPQSSDHALVRVRQAAAVIEAIGSGQRTTPGQPLLDPVGVRLLDAGGVPVPEAAVRFEPARGSGHVEPTEANSDSAGVAEIVWTLGPTPGRQTLRAVAAEGGASVEIEATALDPDEAAASLEVLAGKDQWALAGHALADTVKVRVNDEFGRPVWGATVRFEPAAGSGRADPEAVGTDSLGLASTVWTLGQVPGTERLAVSAAGFEVGLEATAVSDEGACNRTPAVSAEIVRHAQFYGVQVSACSEVTAEVLRTIAVFDLRGKSIGRLKSGDFDGLVRLEELYLDNNGLTELPPDIFDGLPELRRVLLNSNQLGELPPRLLANLERLESLSLSDNRLYKLPQGIFRDLSLRYLDLGSNELTRLPPDIFRDLTSLENLRLAHNRLSELPEDVFEGLSNLELLTIRGNELASLPDRTFSGLSSLGDLRVGDNRLTEIAVDLFAETLNLHRLDLEGNRLRELPSGLFLKTLALQRLYLNDNRLKTLPPGIFDGLQRLVRLDLSSNDLAELPKGVFAGTRLTELSLEYNELHELPPGLFAGLSGLEWVTLQGNPGAPFPIRPEFVRTDGDPLAPGPARVALLVSPGAPFAFTVPVSAQRGSISRDAVSLLLGDTVSNTFEVSANSEGGAVHLGFPPLPEVRADGYEGLRVVRGEELVLFAETENRSPVARSRIPAHRLQAGGPLADLVLADYFDDPDGDSLAFTVEMIDSGVVAARIEDGVLWLDPQSVDTTLVEVKATDPEGLMATHRFRAWVVPAPNPDAFNIELYFEPGFTVEEEAAIRRAADRWMEAVVGDLPDVPVQGSLADYCHVDLPNLRLVGVVDDVLIRLKLVSHLSGSAAVAITCGRRESGHEFIAGNHFALWYARESREGTETLYRSALHEIGHVLGFGDWVLSGPSAWLELFRHGDGDGHFIGPRAVAAFDAAGGESYTGGKVPTEDRIPTRNIHWRKRVIRGDIMAPSGGSVISAITLQALADLGHEVDLSKADPYTLPGAAQGDVRGGGADAEGAFAELFADDVIQGPVVVVDTDGKVVRVIRP